MDNIIYEENVINEISEFIKDNIKLYITFSDEYFTKIRKYCQQNNSKKYKAIPYKDLLLLTKEVLHELYNCYYLYDFRSLE